MMIGRGGIGAIPPVVKNLLIINGLMWLATITFKVSFGVDFNELLGLHYFGSDLFNPYQFVTYMFMHATFDMQGGIVLSHIFFNMFALWMFGSAIENVWGSKRFLIYYLLTGFGAAILHYGIIYMEISPVLAQLDLVINSPSATAVADFASSQSGSDILNGINQEASSYFYSLKQSFLANPDSTEIGNKMSAFLLELSDYIKDSPNVVGASGSLFGILLAFGMMFPNMRLMLLFPPIPIKAKYLVIGYGVMELYSAFQNNPNDNVAHFAHLGGMLFGFLIIKFWEKTGQSWR
jgi:membrane associated rhomboid family serine protease